MSDKIFPTPSECSGDSSNSSGAVCIHTDKVYDQCRDKDCLTDLRVYLTSSGQDLVNKAMSVKIRKAEIIWVYSDIEALPFNRGYYSVDLRYFFKITLDVFSGIGKPCKAEGLATFDKKVILFGSEGNAKVFSSKYKSGGFDQQGWQKTNMPTAIIETVEPIALSSKVVDPCDKCCYDECDPCSIPSDISAIFEENLVTGPANKRVLVTLGVFSIVKLERSVQLLIPSYDFCIPNKECVTATDDNPCDLFGRIEFPLDEFFPPAAFDDCGCDCGCKPKCDD